MPNLPQPAELVQALRSAYANTNPQCYCTCGKFCPAADACTPRRGEIHQPYFTIREAQARTGSQWFVILYDPQAGHILPLNGKAYPTPCQAAKVAALTSGRERRHPVDIQKAVQFCQSPVEWANVERQTAQFIYDAGRALYERNPNVRVFDHPLEERGYSDARAEVSSATLPVWFVSEVRGQLVEVA